MNVNVGPTDRVIRLTVATALFMLGFLGPWGQIVSWILVALGVVMLLVGITQKCPIYSVFGISTCPVDPGK